MDSLFGAEGSLIVRFVVAFVIVLALIGLTFWLIRRFGGARVGNGAQRGRQPPLAGIDAAPVDGRRRARTRPLPARLRPSPAADRARRRTGAARCGARQYGAAA